MQTIEALSTSPAPLAHGDDSREPFLEVAGFEGSILRATPSGLTVCPCNATGSQDSVAHRHWGYDQLGDVRLDAYGNVGVIRATIRSSGTLLPLLLLEPDQIAAARRTLEIVWNLMGSTRTMGRTA
jgi:hypothetical protein